MCRAEGVELSHGQSLCDRGCHLPERTGYMISGGVGPRTLWAREESAEISRSWGCRRLAWVPGRTRPIRGNTHLYPEIGKDPPVPLPIRR